MCRAGGRRHSPGVQAARCAPLTQLCMFMCAHTSVIRKLARRGIPRGHARTRACACTCRIYVKSTTSQRSRSESRLAASTHIPTVTSPRSQLQRPVRLRSTTMITRLSFPTGAKPEENATGVFHISDWGLYL
jgi:hypothetical protein